MLRYFKYWINKIICHIFGYTHHTLGKMLKLNITILYLKVLVIYCIYLYLQILMLIFFFSGKNEQCVKISNEWYWWVCSARKLSKLQDTKLEFSSSFVLKWILPTNITSFTNSILKTWSLVICLKLLFRFSFKAWDYVFLRLDFITILITYINDRFQ